MDFAELDLTLEPLISQLVPPDFAIYRSEFPFGCARGACLTVAGQPDNTPPVTTLELRSDNRSELARLLRQLKCNLKNFSDGALLSGVRFILFSGSAGIAAGVLTYLFLLHCFGNARFLMLPVAAVAAVFVLLFGLLLGSLEKNDLQALPAGERILSLLQKIKLLK